MGLVALGLGATLGWFIGSVVLGLSDDSYKANPYGLHLVFVFVLFYGLDRIIALLRGKK